MKRWLAMLFCVLLMLTVACPVWAESTTETGDSTSVTEPTVTEPTVSETDPTVTEPTTTETQPEPNRHKAVITIAYENGEIIIRVKDENGQPVRSAPVTVAADTQVFSDETDGSGVAVFPMAEEPAQIICDMPAFQGPVLAYEAASASVVLRVPTTPSPTTEATTLPPVSTTEPTKKPSSGGTMSTWSTSDPDTSITQIVPGDTSATEATTTEEPAVTAPEKKSALPTGMALALIIVGGVLLVMAIALLVVFLVRAPRTPVEETASVEKAPVAPVETAEEAPVEESDLPAEEEAPAEETSAEEAPTAPGSVSLEDLFRDR